MERRYAHDLEQQRRSVAMLPTGAWALRREPALELIAALAHRDRQLLAARRELVALLALLEAEG